MHPTESAITASPSVPQPIPAHRLAPLCWGVAFLLLLTHAVLVWQTRSPAVTPSANDDAQYLLLARSLRSFHYQDQHLLGSPVHAQYPPVYPALIAMATGVLGEDPDVAAVVTLLCSLIALLLVYDMARRLTSPPIGLLALAPLVFNAHLVGYSGRISSEPAYVALSIAALWVLVAFPASRRGLLWAGVLAILAGLTRSIGISLIAALLVLWPLQRQFKAFALFAVASAMTVGAWMYWTAMSPDQFSARSYTAVATTTGRHLPGILGMLEVRTLNFFKVYVTKSFAAGLEFPTLAGTSIDNALWILLILGFGGLGLWSVRKRMPLLPLYVGAYLGLLLLYPFKLTRFYMPVAPLILLAMFLGVVELGRRWNPRLGAMIAVLLSGILLMGTVPRSLKLVKHLEHCDRSTAMSSPSCFPPENLAFYAAVRLANDVLPPDAVVLTIKEATFSYYTGRLVYHPDLADQKSEGDILGFLDRNRIRYVAINAFVGGANIATSLAPHCRQIEVLGHFEPRTALFQIQPPGVAIPPARNACGLLQDWSETKEEKETDEEEVARRVAPSPSPVGSLQHLRSEGGDQEASGV